MAAAISFLAGENFTITDLAGNGLGFYGAGSFGASVRVGAYQDNTYITDATGGTQVAKVDNVKFVHPNSGELATGDVHNLLDIPNYLSTLNIRFTNDTPSLVQNATVTVFDRVNINSPATGVTTKIAQIIHPSTTMGGSPTGSGDAAWWTPGGSGGVINGVTYDPPVPLANSPGTSGLQAGGTTPDTQHDWFLAVAASPDTVGSKTQYGLFVALEYL